MNLIRVEVFARYSLLILLSSIALCRVATAQERNRWEFISSGASALGDQSPKGLVQRASALKALSTANINAANRYVFRFMAFPGVNPKNLADVKNTKFVIGVEVSNDLHNRGRKDIQLFYGLNANLGKLFN